MGAELSGLMSSEKGRLTLATVCWLSPSDSLQIVLSRRLHPLGWEIVGDELRLGAEAYADICVFHSQPPGESDQQMAVWRERN